MREAFSFPSQLDWWDVTIGKKQLYFLMIHSGLGLYVGLVTLWFGSISQDWGYAGEFFTSSSFLIFVMNFIPPLLLLWLFTALFNSPWLGYFTTCILCLIVSLVNYFKITHRGEPFFFSDLSLTFEAFRMAGEYSYKLSSEICLLVLLYLLGFVLEAGITPLFLTDIFDKKHRYLSAIIGVFLIPCLTSTIYSSDSLYQKWDDSGESLLVSRTDRYLSRGMWYSFLYNGKDNSEISTDLDVEELLFNIEELSQPNFPIGDISVVGIMLEGFCDYSQFSLLSREEKVMEVYEPWHDWQADALSGNIVNTVFAGGTATTEWSFLTGIPSPDSITHYTNSYVWEFKEAGYYTHGGHPGYKDFYNRINANRYIGFDDYVYYEDYYKNHVSDQVFYWDSDDVLVDSIIEHRKAAQSKNKPIFSFYVSIQNHGPYNVAADMSDPYISASNPLNSQVKGMLQTYLKGVESTLEEMERLRENLNDTDEPVVAVIFGDHKPWAGNDNEILIALEPAHVNNTSLAWMMAYYSTPYLIWANDAAREIITGEYIGDGGDISNHFLMNRLFEMVGWDQSPTMTVASNLMESLPIVFKGWDYAFFMEDHITMTPPIQYNDLVDRYLAVIQHRQSSLYIP